jgi:hypothetical protein
MNQQTATKNVPVRLARTLNLMALALLPALAVAQAPAEQVDALAQHVLFMLKNHGGKTICLAKAGTVFDVRREVLADYPDLGHAETLSPQAVGRAMWTKYPCPFSPQRPELRAATAADIQGAWLFPETSQRLRFGPQVQANQPAGMPIKCESVAYFAPNELRVAQVMGRMACPFGTAADLAPQRKNPVVSTWELRDGGRLVVHRSDVQGHIEEWDVYAVTQDFTMYGITFKAGDLLQYLRRGRGNELNVTMQFRHLQALK